MSANENSKDELQVDRALQADKLAAGLPLYASSVCMTCENHRTVVSGKGSVFMLCQLEPAPNNWPKYPRQPMLRCNYHVASSKQAGSD